MSDVTEPVVLVGVDGSQESAQALRWADRYAQAIGGSLLVVSAWEEQWGTESGVTYDTEFDRVDSTAAASRTLVDVLGPDRAENVRFHVSHGNSAKLLIDASKDADVVVIGNRGRGGFKGLLLGSVSQQVVAHAHCPVVVVRGDRVDADMAGVADRP